MFKVANNPQTLQLDNEQPKGVDLTLNNVFIKCVVIAVYLCQMLLLFNRSTFESIVGPVLAVCIIILTFTPYYYIPFAVVLLTPHEVGTVFMGRMSFYMMLGFVLIFRLFVVKFQVKFTLSDIAWLLLGLFNCLHLYIFMFDHVGSGKMTFMVIFTLWFIYLRCDAKRDEEIFNKFLEAFAVAITTCAAMSLVAQTATLYAEADRMGLIGIGSNDPNIAAMIISLGIAVTLSSKRLKMWFKVAGVMIMCLTIITTVSISGFLAILLVMLLLAAIMNKNKHNISILLIIIFGALLAVYVFPMLGIMGGEDASGETINYLEYYQEKLTDRFDSFLSNNYDDATSGRTALSRLNLKYFSEQSAMTQLFGGVDTNPLGEGVSHNTFVDLILRFGYIGFFVVAMIIIYSVVKCMQTTKNTGNCTVLLCKFLMLYWSFTLSIFDGSIAVLWFAIVLML